MLCCRLVLLGKGAVDLWEDKLASYYGVQTTEYSVLAFIVLFRSVNMVWPFKVYTEDGVLCTQLRVMRDELSVKHGVRGRVQRMYGVRSTECSLYGIPLRALLSVASISIVAFCYRPTAFSPFAFSLQLP